MYVNEGVRVVFVYLSKRNCACIFFLELWVYVFGLIDCCFVFVEGEGKGRAGDRTDLCLVSLLFKGERSERE